MKTIKIAWKGIASYPVRTLLAVLGITISSLLVTFIVSLLFNFKLSMQQQIKSVGAQQIAVVPGRLLNHQYQNTDLSSMLSFTSMSSSLTAQDSENVKKVVPDIDAASPQFETITTISNDKKSSDVIYTGVSSDLPAIFRFELEEGRFLAPEDEQNQAQVVILGQTVKENLFGQAPALGKKVKIKGLDFTVVGVLQKKELLGFNFDERAYAPYKVVEDTANLQHASMLLFKYHTDRKDVGNLKSQIVNAMIKNHPTRDFSLLQTDEAVQILDKIMLLVTAVTIGVTGISLLVGGIGIMNVMLLTVKERTREIGIRKAVGAPPWNIMMQFLLEAMFISVLGCIVGLGLTYALLKLLHHYYPIMSAQLPLSLVGQSIVYSIVLGLVFGIIPAFKALRIKPIEALRYE